MSLKMISRSVRFLQIIRATSNRQIVIPAALNARRKPNWKNLNRECEERTKIILKDRQRLEHFYTAPKFNQNVSQLFNFFPLSPDKVEGILLDHPEILNHDAKKVIDYIKLLVGKFGVLIKLLVCIMPFKMPGITTL